MASNPTSTNKLQYLVVDSGAIIRGQGFTFHSLSHTMCTVPEVLAEIRDSKSRDLLETLPFHIDVRSPTEKSMKAVAEFAKKTGDFAALSLTDLKLIALLHSLEVEVNGEKNIRSEPKGKSNIRAQSAGAVASSSSQQTSRSIAPINPPANDTSSNGEATAAIASPVADASIGVNVPQQPETVDADELSDGEDESSQGDEEEEDDDTDYDIAVKGTPGQLEGYFPSLTESRNMVAADDDEDEPNEIDVTIVDGKIHLRDQCTNHLNHSHMSPEELHDALNSSDWKQVGCGATTTSPSDQNNEVKNQAAPIASAWGKPKSWASIAALAPVEQEVKKPVIDARVTSIATLSMSSAVTLGAPVDIEARTSTDDTNATAGSSSITSEPAVDSSVSPVVTSTSSAPRSARTTDGQVTSRILNSGGGGGRIASERAAAEDDGSGWINASNIASVRALGGGLRAEKPRTSKITLEQAKTACITTDFAMQNVMIQMGLNVISVDGLIIRSVKQFVLMCIGCKKVHYDMDRLFCSKCGGHHLCRVAASLDAKSGELRLHLKKNYHYDLRGSKYSIPLPGKNDKYDPDILLREDQLMGGVWRQRVVKIRRDVRSAFGEDIASDVGVHVNKGGSVVVGYGRKNPNEEKGRERRGKKKH